MGYSPIQTPLVTQTSTAVETAILGSTLDLRNTIRGNGFFQISETGGIHPIRVTIYASMDGLSWTLLPLVQDPIAGSQYGNPWTIIQGTTSIQGLITLTLNEFPNWLRVSIADVVSGNHGVAQVQGFGA